MSIRIHLCARFPADPDAVWAAVEDVATHVEWMADAERITFRTDQRSGVGTEFECLTRVGPLSTTDVMLVTEWEPGAVMGIEHRGVVTGRGRFTLTAVGRETDFCWDEQLSFPRWMGASIGERVARPVLEAIWKGNLRRLRERVVAQTHR